MKLPRIMGILNITPDSFSDGGEFNNIDKAVAHAEKMLADGADIIDVGGESTRPNAAPVSLQEELDRTIPVIEKIRHFTDQISIDTRHAKVMKQAFKAGATMINDVSALEDDPQSIGFAASFNGPVCIMHKKGTPQTMQQHANYNDIVQEIYDYFHSRISICEDAGINKGRLIIDPGLGFAKTAEHNLEILKNLDKFTSLGCPILIGASRKSFIKHLMNNETPADKRLGGSLAANLYALDKGASILRVHDVYETFQAVKMWQSIQDATAIK